MIIHDLHEFANDVSAYSGETREKNHLRGDSPLSTGSFRISQTAAWTLAALFTLSAGCSTDMFRSSSDGPVSVRAENAPPPAPVRVVEDDSRPAASEPAPVVTVAEPAPATASRSNVEVRPDHPETYVVVRGDTLWDIAERFLNTPWVWPQIWDVNPQIANPHLIYPGDVITLIYVDGQPRLQVARPGATPIATNMGTTAEGLQVVRLSPRVRTEELAQAIPSIPASTVQQFTVRPRVVTREELDAAPYIIGNYDQRLVSATGNEVYARGIRDNEEALYSVYHVGDEFIDPDSGESLGIEVQFVANAKVRSYGDPATLLITENNRETLNGDKLLPQEKDRVAHNYIPRTPDIDFEGKIISLFDAISHSAQNQVVVINLGQRDGIEVGDVLNIERRGGTIRDHYAAEPDVSVDLPPTQAGVLMVFRVFDRVSYGLIMKSRRAVVLGDLVVTP